MATGDQNSATDASEKRRRREGGWGLASGLAPKPVRWIAFSVLAATFILPPGGLGLPTCAFWRLTGHPCPGCGMTRALTALSHLDLLRAWQFHPFAIPAWLIVALFALAAVIPFLGRRLERFLLAHDRILSFWIVGGFAALFAFGISRWMADGWWF